MVKFGLLARLEAKPGKEEEGAKCLIGALPLAENEPAIRLGSSTFGIFDVFPEEAGGQAQPTAPSRQP